MTYDCGCKKHKEKRYSGADIVQSDIYIDFTHQDIPTLVDFTEKDIIPIDIFSKNCNCQR